MAASSSDSRSFLSDTRSTSPSYVQDRPLYEPPYKKKAITDEHEKQKTFAQIPWANIKIRSNGRGNTRISQTSDFRFFASFSFPLFCCVLLRWAKANFSSLQLCVRSVIVKDVEGMQGKMELL